MKAWGLVGLQMGCLWFLLVPLPSQNPLMLILAIPSFAFLIAAVIAMPRRSLNVSPVPTSANILVTRGPYRIVRHPMYFGLIMLAAGVCIADFTWLRFLAAIALFLVLDVKRRYEEGMLMARHAEYKEYQVRVSALIPFVY